MSQKHFYLLPQGHCEGISFQVWGLFLSLSLYIYTFIFVLLMLCSLLVVVISVFAVMFDTVLFVFVVVWVVESCCSVV